MPVIARIFRTPMNGYKPQPTRKLRWFPRLIATVQVQLNPHPNSPVQPLHPNKRGLLNGRETGLLANINA